MCPNSANNVNERRDEKQVHATTTAAEFGGNKFTDDHCEDIIDIFSDSEEVALEDWEPVVMGEHDRTVTIYFLPRRIWIWDASRLLSSWCLENPEILKGKTVLEVGSGLGLPSLAASMQAETVIATDFSQQALDALDEAVAFNSKHESNTQEHFENIRTSLLDWRAVFEAEGTPQGYALEFGQADLVLGADVIYTMEHPLPLAATIDAYLKPGGTLILTAKDIRSGLSVFFANLQERGFITMHLKAHIGETDGDMYTLYHLEKPLLRECHTAFAL